VPKNDDFGAGDDDLLCGDGGSCDVKAVENAMDVLKVLPDELANARVFRDRGVAAIISFVVSGRPLNGAVIYERSGNVRDFRGEEEGYVVMEYCYGVHPALWEASQPQCADGGLYCGEVTRGDIKSAVVITDEEVEHGIARLTCHGLYNLISKRRDPGITDCDCIEGLQVMNKVEGAVLLLHAEGTRVVGGVGGLIDTSSKLVLEDLDDVVEEAIGDGDVLVCPGNMLNGWDLDRREVVIAEATLLLLGPCKAEFVDFEDML
jgi:hypothetical protein